MLEGGTPKGVARRIAPLPKYKPDAVLADFETRMPALLGLVFTYDSLKKKKKKTNCHMSQKTFPIRGGEKKRRKTPNVNKLCSDVTPGVCLQFRLCGCSGFGDLGGDPAGGDRPRQTRLKPSHTRAATG